jgi:hypothetical protein
LSSIAADAFTGAAPEMLVSTDIAEIVMVVVVKAPAGRKTPVST